MATTATVNLIAGAKFTLLGTDLTAFLKVDDKGQTYYVFHDVTTPSEGVTFPEVLSDVRKLMGLNDGDPVPGLSETDVKGQLQAASPKSTFDIAAVRFTLRTVYLKYVSPTGGSATAEYALLCDISAKGLVPPDVKLFNIDSLTIGVWNTTNPAVLKQMQLSIDPAAA